VDRRKLISGLTLSTLTAQFPTTRPKTDIEDPGERRLPNGKLQREMILEEQHKRSLEDTQKLADLALALKKSLQEQTRWVMNLDHLKQLEEMDKLVKRLRVALKG
jgi:hypothetical protein